jgi:hypothetical protein
MPSRAHLELQARMLGVNPSNYPNDSKLEQRVLWELENASTVTGALSTGTLTGTANPANGDTITIGSRTYTYATALTEAAATNTILSNGTNVSPNDQVTINSQTYTFVTTLGYGQNQVFIGASASASLQNLVYAILGTGTVGTNYSTGTVANTQVSASLSSLTITLTALTTGTQGNYYTLVSPAVTLTVGGPNFTGGLNAPSTTTTATATGNITNTGTQVVDGDTVTIGPRTYRFKTTMLAPYDVQISTTATLSMTNLLDAITGAGTAGTNWYAGTLTNPQVTATQSGLVLTISALTPGFAGNGITISDTSAYITTSANLTGGVNPGPIYQILIGTTLALTLTYTGEALGPTNTGRGTQWSSNIPTNPDITVGTVTATTITVSALNTAVNNLATTKSSSGLAWGASTLTGGTPSVTVPTNFASDVQAMAGAAQV